MNARQAEVLALQADDLRESLAERKRETDLRHRDQASRVFTAEETYDTNPEGRPATDVSPPSVTAVVSNTSDQPIYEAALCWHLWTARYGDPNRESLDTIMPGERITRTRTFPVDTDMAASGAVVRFRDAAGRTPGVTPKRIGSSWPASTPTRTRGPLPSDQPDEPGFLWGHRAPAADLRQPVGKVADMPCGICGR